MVGLSAGSVAGRVTASIGGSRTVCIGRPCGSLVRPLAHGDDRHIWSLGPSDLWLSRPGRRFASNYGSGLMPTSLGARPTFC